MTKNDRIYNIAYDDEWKLYLIALEVACNRVEEKINAK